MAELSTYRGINPVTVILTAAAAARGLRVTRNSSGLCAAAAIDARGDYILLQAGAASDVVAAAAIGSGGKVPVIASEALVVGDVAYTAASGKVSKTSGGGALAIGRVTQAASGDGVLGEVELIAAVV